MSRERFYVTTPIYYVNDRPHVGHAYTSVLADVFARYHRMLGIPTWALTGTDEHGQKIQDSADALGITPQELCDQNSRRVRELQAALGCSYDDFIRTTEERHESIVLKVATALHETGDVYLGEYEGWYCTRCERYFTDNDVREVGEGRCPEMPDLHQVARLKENNYFFRMAKYAERLKEALESGELDLVPEKRKNEILGLIRLGVPDLCISRPKEKLSWGVPFPFDEDYVAYVWVDALFNYKSAIGFLSDDPAERERHATWWPEATHLIGKDILKQHALFWPTLLLSLGERLPKKILAHGWLLDGEGGKISKTKREGGQAAGRPRPTIEQMLAILGVDGTRWFLAGAMKPGDDARFDWDIVRERLNTDLANGIGNSLSRILRMITKNAAGIFPDLGEGTAADHALRDVAQAAVDAVQAFPDDHDLAAIVRAIRKAEGALGEYLSAHEPWKLVKQDATRERGVQVLAWGAEALRLVGLAATPIMPTKMAVLRARLGWSGPIDFDREARFGATAVGTALGEPPRLFPRIDETDLPAANADVTA